jgi:drug/metabolite transporter (DMT)-like permease
MVAQKTRVFTALVVFTNVVGNLLLSMGMRQLGSLLGQPPIAYIQALFHPLVAAGVALLIVWLISQMTLLSWADLSYVVPVTSIGYVLSALAGRVFLHELVTWKRWGGIGLIILGFILVSRTKPRASRAKPRVLACP